MDKESTAAKSSTESSSGYKARSRSGGRRRAAAGKRRAAASPRSRRKRKQEPAEAAAAAAAKLEESAERPASLPATEDDVTATSMARFYEYMRHYFNKQNAGIPSQTAVSASPAAEQVMASVDAEMK